MKTPEVKEGQEKVNRLTVSDVARQGNRVRVRRFRAKHRRIDYVPSQKAAEIIQAWSARRPDNCTAGVIDWLVCAGHTAISGNGSPK